MEYIQDCYVINLTKCKNRLRLFDNNMKQFMINYKIYPAFDGNSLNNEQLSKYTNFLSRYFLLSPGMIGCYLSHLNLWKQLDSKDYSNEKFIRFEPWFIIMEDDSHVIDGFKENITNIFNDLKNWNSDIAKYPECINLANIFSPIIHKITPNLSKGLLFLGTSAYLVSKSGLKSLIKSMDVDINYHVDLTINKNAVLFGDLSYYVTNNFIKNGDNFMSNVSNTYPKLAPNILNYLFYILGVNNHMHIMYDSSMMVFNRTLGINMFLIIYIFIISLLIVQKQYKIILILIISEIIFDFYVSISKKNEC